MNTTKVILTLVVSSLSIATSQQTLAHLRNVNLTPTYSSGTNYDYPTLGAGTLAYDPSGSLNNGYSALGANAISATTTSHALPSAADPCASGGHTGCYTINDATRFGWYNGTQSNLGDTHIVTGTPDDAIFYIGAGGSIVNLAETQYSNTGVKTTGLNPAFTVYSGIEYNLSHDGMAADPLNPSALANGYFVTTVSPTDSAPNDPSIRSVYFDNVGNVINNPDWNKTFTQIQASGEDAGYVASGQAYNANALTYLATNFGNQTPAQWYSSTYVPHDGYRDTLNYTQISGLFDPGTPNKPYLGQFDAFGNWTIADSTGATAVSGLQYVASASDTPCSGPNCTDSFSTLNGVQYLTHGAGGVSHTTTGSVALANGVNSADETLQLYLPQGWYTVWFGGESGVCTSANGSSGCTGVNGGLSSGAGASRLNATLTLDITPAAVPLPASVWLFGSALAGFVGVYHRKKVIV